MIWRSLRHLDFWFCLVLFLHILSSSDFVFTASPRNFLSLLLKLPREHQSMMDSEMKKELPDEKALSSDSGSNKGEKAETSIISTDFDSTALIDEKAERALVWKFDLRILPVLAIMYLFNSLDKSNLGNAKTAGLEKTLGLKDHDYNVILSIFFIPYVLTAPFLGIAGKKYGPNRVLPIMMFSFGCFTVLVTAVKNFSGLLALRWFLGMAESAFFPLVIYYQTTFVLSIYDFTNEKCYPDPIKILLIRSSFYRRGELARRLALFYAAQSIASAFSGLLAFGVFQIKTGSLADWRYLFIIEGSV